MDDRDRLRELRAAVATRNGESLIALLQDPWPDHALQLIGDGLLDALGRDVAGAREPASVCVTALRERDWEGDEDLASALDARLGAGATPLLRPLPVDLEQLSGVLEGDPVAGGGGRIDLQNGEVWPGSAIEYAIEVGDEDEDEDDRERWLWVANEGSRAGYRDMERFTASIEDPDITDRLERALDRRGAFRRFRNQLTEWPELQSRWYAYSAERQRGRARAWLASGGYTPTPAAPPETPAPTRP
ncbi:MAG TPA: UPF0158 family protein [Nocardioides sp.]|jgi:hypothetical protein|nr:UPF0158 family protein [Nocardioides sp.]